MHEALRVQRFFQSIRSSLTERSKDRSSSRYETIPHVVSFPDMRAHVFRM